MNRLRALLLPPGMLLIGAAAQADFLDGRVVDSNGVGIANVDLDVKNLGSGGTPNIINDGTDALGFFHVTVPNGTYRVTFNPPQPPASRGLLREIEPVTISGTQNMGTVVLTDGVVLSGRVVNSGGVAVAGVNIDAIDALGNNAVILYDGTDAQGNFSFAAPVGTTEIRFDTSTVIGATLAPLAIPTHAISDIAFGTLTLPPGFVLSALVRNAGGTAVSNCDVDVFDATSGAKLYTPGDDSNASGFVDFVVPSGTFEIQFCPLIGNRLVSRVIGPQVVNANATLGVVTLQSGVLLSGTVRNGASQPVPGADVDVRDHTTLLGIPLCAEGTNASGGYAVIVPTGNLDIFFDGPTGSGLGTDAHAAVAIGGDTVLNGTLPAYTAFCFGDGSGLACPCGNNAAVGSQTGCASSLGVGGRVTASGAASLSADTLVLTGTQMPNSSALYFQGTTQQAGGLGAVFGDGLRCASGSVIRLVTKANAGGASQYPAAGDAPVSVRGANSAGTTRTYQVWYRNAAAFCTTSTFNLTNGVQVPWAV